MFAKFIQISELSFFSTVIFPKFSKNSYAAQPPCILQVTKILNIIIFLIQNFSFPSQIGSSEDGSDSGLNDDELEAAIATLQSLASSLECSCVKLRDRKHQHGTVAQFLIRRLLDQSGNSPLLSRRKIILILFFHFFYLYPKIDFLEIRVAVVGNVDAGKSTLLGVLTHGELDNGRGHARQKLFRHKHEMESGRTSSVGNDILGFDCEGNVVNKPEHGSLDWVKICEKSSKVITFIDLAGHERYLKTTVFGMTGHAPDFGMLMVISSGNLIIEILILFF